MSSNNTTEEVTFEFKDDPVAEVLQNAISRLQLEIAEHDKKARECRECYASICTALAKHLNA
jgi:hypothetical protein